MQTKTCPRCKQCLPIDSFYVVKRQWGTELSGWCKACTCADRKRFREKFPDKVKENKRRYYQKNKAHVLQKVRDWRALHPEVGKKYQENFKRKHPRWRFHKTLRQRGVTTEQYWALYKQQGEGCAICHMPQNNGKRKMLFVDHDHKTGEFRGLLCHRCNAALERVEAIKDWAASAMRYLANPPFRSLPSS